VARRSYDTYVNETERWTLAGQDASKSLGKGWTQDLVYSITDRGTYCRFTFISPEGKTSRAHWAQSGVTRERLIEMGFNLTKRRKPKKVNIK